MRRLATRGTLGLALWLFAGTNAARAQPPAPLTLDRAIAQAVERYPAIRAASEQLAAAEATLALTRTAYLPRVDALWQANLATRSNVAGLLLPQSVISSITGPVTASSNDTAWNSAAGVLFAWEPMDFGYRAATVRAAEATREAARAGTRLTSLQVGAAAADAFLGVLAAGETLRAASANLDRARTLFDVVDARARAGLRPGADSARSRAEVAAAESARARAEQTLAVARAELARWLGTAPEQIAIAPGPFHRLPAPAPASPTVQSHPLVQEHAARVDAAKAAEAAAARTYVPRIFLEGTAFARGSSVQPDPTLGGANGFDFGTHNWAAGINVTFPLFDLPAQRDRHAVEMARAHEAEARYAQAVQDLASERLKARAALEAARRVAALTPTELDAARTAEEQARARYGSGLGTIAEVAEAERLLTQADTSNALAILSVWRGELLAAAAAGDLTPLVTRAAQPEGR